MGPTFRAAGAADLDAVLALMRELFDEDRLPDQRAFDTEQARRALADLVAHPSWGTVWLICDAGTVVGYLALTYGYSLEFHGRDAFVDEVYINPAYRGRGWGSQAMRHAERSARSVDVAALHLEVGRGNTAAQRLYRRLGYADHDRYLMTKWIEPDR
jgi:ribosomal protein S18 acetylase RimI-like enzyme